MAKKVSDLLEDLKDNNIYFSEGDVDETLLEELDSKYDLFHEIEISIYNNYIDENFTEKWKNSIIERGLFLLKKDETKVYLHEFIDLVGLNEDKQEWFMVGDEEYREDEEFDN